MSYVKLFWVGVIVEVVDKMSNTLTKTVIVDGEHLSQIRIYMASDGMSNGASGEFVNDILLDASMLAGSKSITNIYRVQGSLIGFSARLEFDATEDLPFMTLATDESFDLDFRLNKLPNNTGVGSTGDVTITTNGFNKLGDEGFIVFTVGKD